MLRSLREFLQWRQDNSIILAEANVLPATDMEYFGRDGDRMHMMFNFHVNHNLFYAMAAADSVARTKADTLDVVHLSTDRRSRLQRDGRNAGATDAEIEHARSCLVGSSSHG